VHAILTSETQLEALSFLAQPQVDGGPHGY
jgi:hypothetical protein